MLFLLAFAHSALVAQADDRPAAASYDPPRRRRAYVPHEN
jgi:hypothetical protein